MPEAESQLVFDLLYDSAQKSIECLGEDRCKISHWTASQSTKDKCWDVSPQRDMAPQVPDQQNQEGLVVLLVSDAASGIESKGSFTERLDNAVLETPVIDWSAREKGQKKHISSHMER